MITLRRGVLFHNGKSMTADDVLYSWRRILDPKNKAGSFSSLEPILDMQQTRKVNEFQIEVHLKQPRADLAFVLADRSVTNVIVPDGATDLNTKPIGTGPFRFVSWTPGERSLFAKNPDYWDGPAHLDELELISIEDPEAQLNALLAGQVDAVDAIDFATARANAKNSKMVVFRSASSQSVPITMRVDTKPFRDKRVREAMRLSVDREKMVQIAFLGLGRVGNDLYGPSWPSYNKALPQRKYDPERAKSLLKAAGYGDGLTVTLPTASAALGMLESATAWVQQAKKAGINVKLRKIPANTYFEASSGYLKAPLYQSAWGSSFESQAQQAFVPGGPYLETKWHQTQPAWVASFRKAQALLDPAAQKRAFADLQRKLWEEGGDIVWGFSDRLSAISPKVKGIAKYPDSNLGNYRFATAWLES